MLRGTSSLKRRKKKHRKRGRFFFHKTQVWPKCHNFKKPDSFSCTIWHTFNSHLTLLILVRHTSNCYIKFNNSAVHGKQPTAAAKNLNHKGNIMLWNVEDTNSMQLRSKRSTKDTNHIGSRLNKCLTFIVINQIIVNNFR
jgi:hypothetical protein